MGPGADIAARLALNRRIMEQSKHRIAVADGVDEIIFVDVEVAGDRLEDLEPGAVERLEHLLERLAEAFYLGRPDIVGHVVAEAVAGGKLPADMPEFLEVVRLGALGGLDSERGIAARAAAAGNQVFALGLLGQGEEGPRFLFGAVDELVGDAVVGDDGEAIFREASAEPLGEGIGVAVGVGQRDRGDRLGRGQSVHGGEIRTLAD
jgi:hypothetical protein